jgi:NAD(P)-dependent dehydrogenase (short-subunit alcohol dehydrogenase family)
MTRTDESPIPEYGARLSVDGRRFVVLGAGQGIGRQAAHALAQGGARLVCVDRDASLAEEISAEVDARAWSGDMTRRADVERLFDLVADVDAGFGGLDGVVDIIGMARWSSVLDCDDDDYDWQLDMNLRHAYLTMQYAGRLMRAGGRGGAMAFVASVSGLTGAPMHGPYGAAKAGLMALVRTAAVEMAPYGIRVNAVAPGPIWTPRMQLAMSDELRDANVDNVPLGRMGAPADIAGALLFLVSDLAAFVSGQTLVVDGAVGAKFPYPDPTDFVAPSPPSERTPR